MTKKALLCHEKSIIVSLDFADNITIVDRFLRLISHGILQLIQNFC